MKLKKKMLQLLTSCVLFARICNSNLGVSETNVWADSSYTHTFASEIVSYTTIFTNIPKKTFTKADGTTCKLTDSEFAKSGKYPTIMEGCCVVDNDYYFAMVYSSSISSTTGYMVRYATSENKWYVSGELPISHGNDFCYNPKLDVIVSANCSPDPRKVTLINPKTMTLNCQKDLTKGVTRISYDAENDRYYASSGSYEYILNADFTFTSHQHARQSVSGYVNQGSDCTTEYVFNPISKDDMSVNRINISSWYENYEGYIEIPIACEIEDVFHVGNAYYFSTTSDLYRIDITRGEDLGNNFYAYITNTYASDTSINSNHIDNALTLNPTDNDVKLNKKKTNSNYQKWKFEQCQDGTYKIINVGTGNLLTVQDGKTENGANIEAIPDNGTASQRWIITGYEGSYVLQAACNVDTTYVLGVHQGTNDTYSFDDRDIYIYKSFGETSKKFTIDVIEREVDETNLAEKFVDLGESFTATISNTNSGKFLSVNASDAQNVELASGNYGAEQTWYFERNTNGSYKITNTAYDKCLDQSAATGIPNGNVIIYSDNHAEAQAWFIYEVNGSYILRPECSFSCVLDVYGGSSEDGTNIQIWGYHGGSSQLFSINKVADLGEKFEARITFPVADKHVTIDKTMNVLIYTKNAGDEQIWKFEQQSDGSYEISNLKYGKYLNQEEGTGASGGNVNIKEDDDSDAMRWFIYEAGDQYVLRPKCATNCVLDVTEAATANNTNVEIWTFKGSKAQYFTINKIIDYKSVELDTTAYIYDGTEKTPNIIIKDANDTILQKGKDYLVTYVNNTEIGEGKVVVSFIDTCKGSVQKKFTIGLDTISELKQNQELYSTTSVEMNWTQVAGAEGYEIYRSTEVDDAFMLLDTSTANKYKNTALKRGSTFYYKVRAYKTVDGEKLYGSYSDVVEMMTQQGLDQVTGLKQRTYAYSSTAIDMSWGKVSGAEGYVIYRSTSGTGKFSFLKTVNTNSYKNRYLRCGNTFYYKVRAFKTVNGSKVYGSFSKPVKMITKPGIPQNVTLTAGSRIMKVKWTARDNTAIGFAVYASTSRYGTYKLVKTTDGDTSACTVSGLKKGTKYYFKVKAYRLTPQGENLYSGCQVKRAVVK